MCTHVIQGTDDVAYDLHSLHAHEVLATNVPIASINGCPCHHQAAERSAARDTLLCQVLIIKCLQYHYLLYYYLQAYRAFFVNIGDYQAHHS
jgi:hypothetical protein